MLSYRKVFPWLLPSLLSLVLFLAPTAPGELAARPVDAPRPLSALAPAPFYAAADATTSSSAPQTNYGSLATLGVGRSGIQVPVVAYAYLRFDVGNIPATAVVASASLELCLSHWSDDSTHTVNAYAVSQSWAEGAITWGNQPPAGALAASLSIKPATCYKSWDVTGLVRDWVSGKAPNHGLVLTPGGAEDFNLTFQSREAGSNPPRLVVDYALPTPSGTATATATPTATATATTFPCPDNYEPNDSFGQAPGLLPNTEYWAALCHALDQDYYAINVTAGQMMVAELWDLPADYDLQLYGPAQNLLAQSLNGGTQAEAVQLAAAASGTHYLRVFGKGGAFDPTRIYRFKVTLSAAPTSTTSPTLTHTPTRTPTATATATVSPTATATTTTSPTLTASPTKEGTTTATVEPTPACPDPWEPNDTFGAPLEITPGEIASYICSPADQDYFKIVIDQWDTIELTLHALPFDCDLRLLDPGGAEVASSHKEGTDQEFIRFQAQERGGDYRAHVYSALGASSVADPYLLKLNIELYRTPTPTTSPTPPACASDPFEPNDDFDHPRVIASGSRILGLICPPGDEDWFQIAVPAGYRLECSLSSLPGDYDLCLWGPDHLLYPYPAGACSRNSYTTTEVLSATVYAAGDYRVQVYAKTGIGDWHETDTYDLYVYLRPPTPTPSPTQTRTPTVTPTPTRTTLPPVYVSLALNLDDAAVGVPVAKMMADPGGATSHSWLDVVVEAESARTVWPVDVVVEAPAGFGDPVNVWRRDCPWCAPEDYSAAYTRLAAGRHQVRLNLYTNATLGGYRHQLVLRFDLGYSVGGGTFTVRAYTASTAEHQGSESNMGTIAVVQYPQAIIVTNRRALYEYMPGLNSDVQRLLNVLYDISSGPPWNVVYYADEYSDTVRRWNNRTITYWSTCNLVADIVDDLIEDWASDALVRPPYLCLIGDDPIVPFYRVNDPSDAEADHEFVGVHPVLDLLTHHDGFFTDAKYADLDDDNWHRRPTDLAVGRIVGATPQDMITFIHSGVAGPDVSSRHFVGASWSEMNFDHEYEVHAPLRSFGFDILYDGTGEARDIIDDWNTWLKSDLTDAIQSGFAALGYCGHGDYNWITVPETNPDGSHKGIGSWEIDGLSASGGRLDLNHPILGFVSCRVGFSLHPYGHGSMVNALGRAGASGVFASAGISWYVPTIWGVEYDDWSEEFGQLFWLKLLNRSVATTGRALQEARRGYSAGAMWDGKDEKTIMGFTIFGLPWVRLPDIGPAGGAAAAEQSTAAPSLSPAWSRPRVEAAAADAHSLTAVVDASRFAVQVDALAGFDLLTVAGMDLLHDDGIPVLPATTLTLTLPAGATLSGVTVAPHDPVVIANLDLPQIVGTVPQEGAPPGGAAPVPDSLGPWPPQHALVDLVPLAGGQLVVVRVLPAVYVPALDRATLYTRLDVTVRYLADQPIGLLDLAPALDPCPADQFPAVRATVINVGASAAQLIPRLRVFDGTGRLVGAWGQAAVDVPAGGSASLVAVAGTDLAPGSYRLELALERQGEAAALDSCAVHVVGGRMAGLDGPSVVKPGETGAFTATYHNLLASSTTVTLTLEFTGGTGAAPAPQTAVVTAPAGGTAAAAFSWTPGDDDGGATLLRAWADVGDDRYGPLSKMVDVAMPHGVVLPMVVKG